MADTVFLFEEFPESETLDVEETFPTEPPVALPPAPPRPPCAVALPPVAEAFPPLAVEVELLLLAEFDELLAAALDELLEDDELLLVVGVVGGVGGVGGLGTSQT